MLNLTGSTQDAAFAALLPSAASANRWPPGAIPGEWAAAGYPISTPDLYGAELHQKLLGYGAAWSGARMVLTDGYGPGQPLTFTYPATPDGFRMFAGHYLQAARRAGEGIPIEEQSAILTQVINRVAGSDYMGSLSKPGGSSLTAAGKQAAATLAVTDAAGTVQTVLHGSAVKPGDVVDLTALQAVTRAAAAAQAAARPGAVPSDGAVYAVGGTGYSSSAGGAAGAAAAAAGDGMGGELAELVARVPVWAWWAAAGFAFTWWLTDGFRGIRD